MNLSRRRFCQIGNGAARGKSCVDAKPWTRAALADASVNGQKSKEETQLRFDTLIS
ncbi:MAG: hypothetical protein CBARDCOR_5827 [uncultured Caballeronia sp.]|nr:MAG: hypothetical protein CBARDCOR_5827 [uncultured Caballeronia sp.]